MIAGPTGSGKSDLALALMALGAGLISDDVTFLDLEEGRVMASAPATLSGRIEARGLGILAAPAAPPAPLHAILDLATPAGERLPPPRTFTLLGQPVPLLHRPATSHVAATMMHYMRYGPCPGGPQQGSCDGHAST